MDKQLTVSNSVKSSFNKTKIAKYVSNVKGNAIQYYTVQSYAKLYNTVNCNSVQCSAVIYCTMQYFTVQCNPMQNYTIQYNAIFYSAV